MPGVGMGKINTKQQVIDLVELFINKTNYKNNTDLHCLGIIDVTNFHSLVYSFGLTTVVDRLKELISFLKSKFNEKFFIRLCGQNQIIICGVIRNKAQIISEIEIFFAQFKIFCDKQKFPLYFALNFAAVLFNKRIENNDIKGLTQTLLQQITLLLQNVLNSAIQYNITVHQKNDIIFLKYRNDNELASYFRNALNNKRLAIAYQPIIDAKTGRVAKYEALLRIVTEENDYLTAAPFIKIAEKFGFIDQIDNFVMEKVLEDLRNYPKLKLAMNLSNLTVYNQYLINKANKVLNKDLASRLTLEITETGSLTDFKLLASFAKHMQNLGCKIAIDDFGVGNTSIAQLKKIKADIIKIDGQFIHNIANKKENKAFVSAILKLISEIGAKSVAEFVESEETIKIIKKMGVNYLQGNFISQALNYKPWL